jgi:hypothetical protein
VAGEEQLLTLAEIFPLVSRVTVNCPAEGQGDEAERGHQADQPFLVAAPPENNTARPAQWLDG